MSHETCPICGGPLGKKPYELQDGAICIRCADDLRFQYPIYYLPKVGRKQQDLTRIPACREMSRAALKIVKDHTRTITGYYEHPDRIESYRVDLMHILTVEEFRAALVGADAAEDRIREAYDDYTNVFTVETVRCLGLMGAKGIQNRKRRREVYAAAGYIRAGAFREGDMVTILHGTEQIRADLLALDFEEFTFHPDTEEDHRTDRAERAFNRGETGKKIRAGYQAVLVLSDRAAILQPGDRIVSD